ncbi:hypothetical protein ATC03_12855 [Agromyces aureus]|uniref:N-acetyltransferase domain-containing protein n=1 Tax=Agromyces aureus TaxID=453304 RepID=A0A191WGP1_9MICO|nr:hypothetical protein ATC03_12855 [Agromyces aureus]
MSLRATRDTDLDTLNHIVHDPRTTAGPPVAGPAVSERHRATIDHRTIRADGEIVGDVTRWFEDGRAFVAYRVDVARHDDGTAGRALRLFVEVLDDGPLRARVAAGDTGSIHVLERLGFAPDPARPADANAPDPAVDGLVYLLG